MLAARGADELAATGRAAAHYGGRVVALAGDVADPIIRGRLVAAAWDSAGSISSSTTPPISARARCRRSPSYPVAALERLLAVNVVAPLGARPGGAAASREARRA